MAITLSDVKVTILPGGQRLVSGIATFDNSYAGSGEVMDLSSYIKSTDAPHVTLNPGNATYHVYHDGGTASGGKLWAIKISTAADENAATNLAAVAVNFMAIGDAY